MSQARPAGRGPRQPAAGSTRLSQLFLDDLRQLIEADGPGHTPSVDEECRRAVHGVLLAAGSAGHHGLAVLTRVDALLERLSVESDRIGILPKLGPRVAPSGPFRHATEQHVVHLPEGALITGATGGFGGQI